MGVAKAALESTVRYLAADLGPDGIRVNAISAGPIRTLSASGVRDFRKLYGPFDQIAPMRAHVTKEDVGNTAAFLASDLAGRDHGRDHVRRRRLQHHGRPLPGLTRPAAARPPFRRSPYQPAEPGSPFIGPTIRAVTQPP